MGVRVVGITIGKLRGKEEEIVQGEEGEEAMAEPFQGSDTMLRNVVMKITKREKV